MIEKIFIPTVNRVDNQITYNSLPKQLKDRVVFVVQSWERDQYHYDAEYLVLPDHITTEHPRPVSHTREYIYHHAKNMKYAMIDDDISFARRNAKYWTGESNMEKSKRKCTEDDILEMFQLYSDWLDEPDVTICGCSHSENPPSGKAYQNNTSIGSATWINGRDFADFLPKMKLTETRVAQDIVFVLSLLTNGYGNRVSQEFCFYNASVMKKTMKSDIWDSQTIETVIKDHKVIENMFPGIFQILYNDNGDRADGGFRDLGKWRCHWSKAYKQSQTNSLEEFFA